MNLDQFQQNCLITFKTGDLEESLLHSWMGIVTEIPELEEAILNSKENSTNLLEECGDILFYLVVYMHHRSIPLEFYPQIKKGGEGNKYLEQNIPKALYESTALLGDLVKKLVFYQREMDYKKEMDCVNHIYGLINLLLYIHRTDVQSACKAVISKLEKRYGKVFSTEKANNRDLDGEYQAMQN